MKKNRMIGLGLVIVMCALAVMPVNATNSAQVKQQKQQTQSKLDETNKNISDLENKKKKLQSEINALDSQLVQVLAELGILENDLAEKEAQIEQAQIDYENAVEEQNRQYEAMKQRIKYMYEQGDTMMLEVLLQADSISNMLNSCLLYTSIHKRCWIMVLTSFKGLMWLMWIPAIRLDRNQAFFRISSWTQRRF